MFPIRYTLSMISSYDYTVSYYSDLTNLSQIDWIQQFEINGYEISVDPSNEWLLHFPSLYHHTFFHQNFIQGQLIPTQIVGAVGEIIAAGIMRRFFNAENIRPIPVAPRSKRADYEMILPNNVQAVMEVKSTNKELKQPSRSDLSKAITQINDTRSAMNCNAGFIIKTSFVTNESSIVRVF